MNLEEASFDASTFAKNKVRLLAVDVARRFFEGVVRQARAAQLLSAEHFTVDGTLIEAYASLGRRATRATGRASGCASGWNRSSAG